MAKVGSWTTVDVRSGYEGDRGELAVEARNVLNRKPPGVADSQFVAAWDPYNGSNLLGCVVGVYARYKLGGIH